MESTEVCAGRSRYVFVHVMKTAGTSFAFHLRQQFAEREIYPCASVDLRDPGDVEPYASIENLRNIPSDRRAEIIVYAGHVPYLARDLIGTDLHALTLLRDPLERTISVLNHFKRL